MENDTYPLYVDSLVFCKTRNDNLFREINKIPDQTCRKKKPSMIWYANYKFAAFTIEVQPPQLIVATIICLQNICMVDGSSTDMLQYNECIQIRKTRQK